MFENIGGKLKAFAKISFWVGMVFAVLLGIVEAAQSKSFLLGVLETALWALGIWLETLVVYAVGDIAEKSAENNKLLTKLAASQLEQEPKRVSMLDALSKDEPARPTDGWICEQCGMRNSSGARFCKGCGKYK